jgi:hypothetical protein
VLKSDIECEVQITIDKKEIKPQTQYKQQYQPPQNNYQHTIQNTQQVVPVQQPLPKSSSGGGISWKTIIFIVFLVCGIGAGYYFYQKKVINRFLLLELAESILLKMQSTN